MYWIQQWSEMHMVIHLLCKLLKPPRDTDFTGRLTNYRSRNAIKPWTNRQGSFRVSPICQGFISTLRNLMCICMHDSCFWRHPHAGGTYALYCKSEGWGLWLVIPWARYTTLHTMRNSRPYCQGSSGVSPFGSLHSCLLIKHPWLV